MTQIKELLRIGLFVIIVICGASACSNDDGDDELAKDYKLKEVAWTMQDDEVKIIKQTMPGFFTDNNTHYGQNGNFHLHQNNKSGLAFHGKINFHTIPLKCPDHIRQCLFHLSY